MNSVPARRVGPLVYSASRIWQTANALNETDYYLKVSVC